jgi:N6-L-threonylcarbamoyladenine synthase
MDVIVKKAMDACEMRGEEKLVLAGGVAANSKLREMLDHECSKRKIALYYPAPILCTDNGAMIACAAYYKYMKQGPDGLDMDAYPFLEL